MGYGVVGKKTWGNISSFSGGTTNQGWRYSSPWSNGGQVTIHAPCGGEAPIKKGESASLGGVLVSFHGLSSHAGTHGSIYPLVSIPSGSCNIYGYIPDPPKPPPELIPPPPPMDILPKVSPCFQYFVYNNQEWKDKTSFTGEDFFGKPKT